jgi:hypothetical protein
MRPLILATVIVSACVLPGCATLVNGSRQKVTINSTPGGAIVEYSGSEVGKTPCTIDVSRKSQTTVIVKLSGFESRILNLDGALSGWFWGNIISCGLYGSTTDAVSGSMYKYQPDTLHVSLERIGGSTPADDKGTKVKRFCLLYYKDLAGEISAGKGERLETLRELMGQTITTEAFAKKISKDYLDAKDADEFGERMDLISR